jgi:hypothetical protein
VAPVSAIARSRAGIEAVDDAAAEVDHRSRSSCARGSAARQHRLARAGSRSMSRLTNGMLRDRRNVAADRHAPHHDAP